MVAFAKGQGTGNDFVLLVDPTGALSPTREQVAALCDRRFGIGGDGLIVATRTEAMPEHERALGGGAEWFMDYRNADGSIAEMCGNGIRVFARLLEQEGLADVQDLVVGTRAGHLGQSLWLRELHGREEGPPPRVDLDLERRAGDFVRGQIAAGHLGAVHDVSDGGIAVTIAEMALAGGIGAMIDRALPYDTAASLFAEDQGVYVVTVHDHALLDFLQAALDAGVEAEPLGRTIGTRIIFELAGGDFCVPLDALRAAHEGFFPKLMSVEAAL